METTWPKGQIKKGQRLTLSCLALAISLTHVLTIADLTGVFDRFCIVAYWDYSDVRLTKWSDWETDLTKLYPFIDALKPMGGGDLPEAVKTAFGQLILRLREARDKDMQRNTVVLLLTDAPPHHKYTESQNIAKEQQNLEKQGLPFDWIAMSRELRQLQCKVYCLTNQSRATLASFYPVLSHLTNGCTLYLAKTSKNTITEVIINLMLALFGAEYDLTNAQRLEFGQFGPLHSNKGKDVLAEYLNKSIEDMENEDDKSWGYLPRSLSFSDPLTRRLATSPANIVADPWLETDLRPLISKFDKDEKYRDKVFECFSKLVKPDSVLALTYNSILGTFWRKICKSRNDPRRDQLLQEIDVCLKTMPEHRVYVVKAWLAKSYNQVDSINEANIGVMETHKTRFPIVVMESPANYTPQEILEVARSCSPGILAKIGEMLNSLRKIDEPSESLNEEVLQAADTSADKKRLRYLSLNLNDENLFSFLPHLMAEGTVFSLRPSFIIASLAMMTKNGILKERASDFMKSIKGKWFDFEIPENYTFQFAKFILKMPNFGDYITDQEKQLLVKCFTWSGLMMNLKTTIPVQQPFSAFKLKRPDFKLKCQKCHQMRSWALMTDNQVCGLCQDPQFPNYGIDSPDLENSESHWCECRTCHVHYPVVNVDKLNVSPKCFFCRTNKKAPCVTCQKCQNKFMYNTLKFLDGDAENYTCHGCRVEDPVPECSKPTLAAIMESHASKILSSIGLNIKDFSTKENRSFYKMKEDVKMSPVTKIDWSDTSSWKPFQLENSGKLVLNTREVYECIKNWIKSGNTETQTCLLCFEEFPNKQISVVCGRDRCDTVACHTCLKGWYGSTLPGDIVLPPRLSCPFCKRVPMGKILSQFNRQACALLRTFETFDPQWYYAWCLRCYNPKQYMEHVCAQGIPEIPHRNFRCEPCREAIRAQNLQNRPVLRRIVPTRENDERRFGILENGETDFEDWDFRPMGCPVRHFSS
eukprot:TRINITY_DN392_c0_g1_i1.p1 TRINITY_DN392_c0_g1~~TRINITY_DN392_c0_g1_i1.p1  ORF type:complete len:983 (-),score=260.45 TRINITY_DN392_c0_g1_i1:167-3115(-)